MIGALMRFLVLRKQPVPNHGGRVISPYVLKHASDEEKLLILAGVARSPEDARFLLRKYGTDRARDVLRTLKRRKRVQTVMERLRLLIQRFDGHVPGDPYGKRYPHEQRLPVTYRYRMPKR